MNRKVSILVIIVLSLMFLMISFTFFNTIAQAPPTQAGFWYFKKPSYPPEMKTGTIEFYTQYLDRLQKLSTVPEGTTTMTDMIGNDVVWDAAMLASISVEISRVEAILTALGD